MSLFESLISMILFSIALLALNAMQLTAMHKNINIYYKDIAQRQIHNMEERLLMLRDKAGLFEQVNIWNKQNQEILPKGQGEVGGAYPYYSVELCWGEKNDINTKTGDRAGCISKDMT